MKQRTHTWLAIRAIALLEDSGEAEGLVKILKPNVTSTAIGAWIPDLSDARSGGSRVENHIFKMEPYTGNEEWRFTMNRAKLFEKLGPHRQIRNFIDDWDGVLGTGWWEKPYKADPAPGQHLANRAMALNTTLIDQLILGDPDVAALVPGTVSFAYQLDAEARSRIEEVATYFFMLSHFVADSCQPCHCDARKLSGYDNGLHKEMEAHWDKKIGTYFDKARLMASPDSAAVVLDTARAIDPNFGFTLPSAIPEIKDKDTWLEVLNLCRASFAVISILVNPTEYPYGTRKLTKFEDVFDPEVVPELLEDFDLAVMHDAVLNIAIIWKEVWSRFK